MIPSSRLFLSKLRPYRFWALAVVIALSFFAVISSAEAARSSGRSSRSVPKAKTVFDEEILRVQIYLDEQLFAPGQVDGRIGEYTLKAIAAWNTANRVSDPEDWRAVTAEAAEHVTELYAVYKIKSGDMAFVSYGLPGSPEEMSKKRYLGYRSLGEFVTERFHTTEACLKILNPKKKISSWKVGDLVKVPNVPPFQIEEIGKDQQWKEDGTLSQRQVLVDTKESTAAFYDEKGELFAFFPITPGKPQFIPYGEWKIKVMVATPEFRWDKQLLEKGKRSQNKESNVHLLPPGPNSPVGIFWGGISKSGIGLHGTATPETIGRSRSAGCIRFANWDAVRLPQLIRPGAKVTVR